VRGGVREWQGEKKMGKGTVERGGRGENVCCMQDNLRDMMARQLMNGLIYTWMGRQIAGEEDRQIDS